MKLQFPDQGSNLSPLRRECRVLATGQPGRSPHSHSEWHKDLEPWEKNRKFVEKIVGYKERFFLVWDQGGIAHIPKLRGWKKNVCKEETDSKEFSSNLGKEEAIGWNRKNGG